MRIAVLSDIHANLEAFEAVVDDLRQHETDEIVCLGDLVGYGPDPNGVVERVRQLGCLAILGNHEAALVARKERNRMNFQAKENNISTAKMLSQDNLHYCCSLSRTLELAGALFVHGAPPDSVNTYCYMLSDDELVKLFSAGQHLLYFTGHTHELKIAWMKDAQAVRASLAEGELDLARYNCCLVNCGSVGQPRDRDRRAKYMIWDTDNHHIEVRAVDYDVEATVAKILELGFPSSFAERLR